MALTPDFDLVIIAASDQEGSAGMNGYTSDRAFSKQHQRGRLALMRGNTFVLFESVYEDTHAVVPQLDAAIVQSGGEERLSGMKCESLTRR